MLNFRFSYYNLFIAFCFFVSVFLLLFFITEPVSLLLPYCCGLFIAFIIAFFIHLKTKDVFYKKIYLLTVCFHFLVGLFIQLLKYHILNLPTINGIAAIGVDNDGWLYHSQAVMLLQQGYKEVNFYSYIVAFIYKCFGINEYTVCIINSIFSGFISIIICKLGEIVFLDKFTTKFLGFVVAFSFSIAAYTSVLMRDVFIILLSLLIIYFYYKFFKNQNIFHLFLSLLSFFLLCFFRAYAAVAVMSACFFAHLFLRSKYSFSKRKIHINKFGVYLLLIIISIVSIVLIFQDYLKIDYIVSLFNIDNILEVSQVGYGGANSSFGIDRVLLAKCLPVFILVGYFCMFFAPFPHQWFLAKNIVQAFSASETIILYIFLIPSFFKGVKNGFKNKNFIIIASFLYIIFVFTFYGMILDNSGAVFRGRAPFLPLIFLISLYSSSGLLKKIVCLLNKIKRKY